MSIEKRFCYVGALMLGDEVLLGTVPMAMEDLDLVINPGKKIDGCSYKSKHFSGSCQINTIKARKNDQS